MPISNSYRTALLAWAITVTSPDLSSVISTSIVRLEGSPVFVSGVSELPHDRIARQLKSEKKIRVNLLGYIIGYN